MSVNTITVRNSQELSIAITQLSDGSGGTILVENTSEIYVISRFRPGPDTGQIVITAADPNDPPTFAQVKLVEGQNMVFSGLSFDRTKSGVSGKDLEILKSSDIVFENNTFVNSANGFYTGEDPDVPWAGSLALVRDSNGIVFTGNDVSKYSQGLAVADSVGTVITNNTFSNMIADGVRLSGIQDTLVEGNTFTDFYGSTQNKNHSDMLQVWSAPYNKLNTENLIIRDNFFNSSGGVATQSMFIKNETFRDTGVEFRNITVENNTIYNGHVHGVAIYDTIGVQITNNTFLWNPDATMQSTATSTPVSSEPTIRLINVTDGVVTGNIVPRINAPGSLIEGNALIDYGNPAADNYVGKNFVNAINAGSVDLRDLTLLPDSEWYGQYGSSDTRSSIDAQSLTAVIYQEHDTANFGTVTYDASQSRDADGLLDPANTTYTWTFADGTVLQGMEVTYAHGLTGTHDVILSVTADGVTNSVSRTSQINPDALLSVDFNNGVTDSSSYASSFEEVGTRDDVAGVQGAGFQLTGTNDLRIERENLQLQKMPNFTMDVSLQRAEGGNSGTFVHMFKGLAASITDDGAFRFSINTSDGWVAAETAGGLVSDTDWHHLSVSFGNGALNLYVDGKPEASVEATGIMTINGTRYDLVLGNTWGDSLQGTVDDLTIRKSIGDADAAAFGYATMQAKLAGEPLPIRPQEVEPEVVEAVSDALDAGTAMPVAEPESGQDIPVEEPTSEIVVSPFEAANLLNINFNEGASDSSNWESKLRIKAADTQEEAPGASGGGFVLDGSSKVLVDRSNSQIQQMEKFTLALSLAREEGGDAGTFVNMHKGFGVAVTEEGALKASINTPDGWVSVETSAGLVSDTNWHRVAVVYDGAEGGAGLQLYVDGALEAQTEATGKMTATGVYHMVFGNTWGDSLQGTIDDIVLDASAHPAESMSIDYAAMKQALGSMATAQVIPFTDGGAALEDQLLVSELSAANADAVAPDDMPDGFQGYDADLVIPLLPTHEEAVL